MRVTENRISVTFFKVCSMYSVVYTLSLNTFLMVLPTIHA